MELKLNQREVGQILLAWAAKEAPGKFNTANFSLYGDGVDLGYTEPEIPENKIER